MRAPEFLSILLVVALASALNFLARTFAPLPYAPTWGTLVLSVGCYGLVAVPALLVAVFLPRLRRFSTALAAVPFALLVASLVFVSGDRSRSQLVLATLIGLGIGVLVVQVGGRRSLAAATAFCLTVAVGARSFRSLPTAPPGTSVLLIVLDTTATGHLSTYGYDKPTSPTLDALARRSVVYRRAISPAPWTVPAHASIFSGLYASELGFDGMNFTPKKTDGSLAHDLEESGLAAYGISANPLVPIDDDQMLKGFRAVWRGDRLSRPLLVQLLDHLRRDEEFLTRGQQITDLALDWLDRLAPRGKPWFLFLNYADPHAPYRPPRREHDRFAPGVDPQAVAGLTQLYSSGRVALTPAAVSAMRALYDGEIAAMDRALGRLLAELGRRGYDASNLAVIVTADHGESLGEHGLVGHLRGVPDTVLHVPLLVSGPGVTPGEVTTPVQTVQVRATTRALLGLPPLAGIAPALPPWGHAPEYIIAEHPEPRWYFDELRTWNAACDPSPWLGNWVAVERDGVKVVFDDQGRGSTYDLRRDPEENDPQPLVEGDALAQAYEDWHGGEWATARAIPAGKRRVLKSMGYVN
jgi:arylsulfatase A-like enzyme